MTTPSPLADVARLSLKLGLTAFGGPAAHIAMLRTEVVQRRRWLSEEDFLDLLGAANLIPGPSSTEMFILVGYRRAGWRGMLVGGLLFILPAAGIVLALAWIYVRYGSTPTARWLLYGVKPVIIAVIAQALWGLLKTAVKGPVLAVIGIVALALSLLGAHELLVLGGGGVAAMLAANGRRLWERRNAAALFLPLAGLSLPSVRLSAAPVHLLTLFLTFLKIGAVLYGSGYVLLAFLRNDFVDRLHWLTDRQLLDAVAIGQFTPGPVFTTATFIGYLVGSWWGAVLATVAIFLPSFIYIAAVKPLIPRIRASPWLSAMLDGVNVAAMGLMAAVTLELGRTALVDPLTVLLALAAAVALIRSRVGSAWLVLAGGLVGYGFHLAGG